MKKAKYLSNVNRKYIKNIKNVDMLEIQKSVYARYINMEKIRNINTLKKNFAEDLSSLQKEMERDRSMFFSKKNIIKKSSVYFSSEFDFFDNTLEKLMHLNTTRSSVKKIYDNFKNQTGGSELFLHLICSIFSQVDDLTLSNFRLQLRMLLEKQYKLFLFNETFEFNVSLWLQLSDIIVKSLELSEIVIIEKKLGPHKRTHMVEYISISEKFKSIAVAYDYRSSNMPLIDKPADWQFSKDVVGVYGGFLVDKTDLVVYNKEKSLLTKVGPKMLDNLNFIQQVSYKINRSRLKEILSDFDGYLTSSTDIKIHKFKNKEEYISVNDYAYNRSAYNIQRAKVRTIIETLEQAIFLSNFSSIYFTVYLDFRTRIYYHGWPLNPQGDELSRSLLLFSNQRKKSVTKELDVSASGVQIIGGLMNNLEYLKSTNFIKKRDTSVLKQDLYHNVLKKYLSQRKFNNLDEEVLVTKFLTRKIVKSIIMCYFYNETHFGVVKKLEMIERFPGFNLNKEVSEFRSFLKKEFSDFEFLKNIVLKVVEHAKIKNKAINLISKKLLSTSFQFYAEQEIKRVNYYNHFGKRQKISISIDIEPLSINNRKTRLATLPNLIHSIDALVLHNVIKKSKKDNIPLTVIHDCFIVHKKYEKNIKKWYFDSFCECILSKETPLLIDFLKNNLDNEVYQLVDEINLFPQLDFKKFLNDFEMNDFILSE